MADIKLIEVDGVEYNINDATARTKIGDLSALETEAKGSLVEAINEAARSGGSSPVQYIESLDESNLTNLRDLETGTYVMYGYFRPHSGSSNILTFDNLQVNVVKKTAGSHVLVFSTLNSMVNFLEILVDESAESGFTYSRTDISMLDLFGLIAKVGTLDDLTTTEKTSLVGAINEVAEKLFIVEVYASTMTASHSASEIIEAANEGKLVYGKDVEQVVLTTMIPYTGFDPSNGDNMAMFSTGVSVDERYGISERYFWVSEDKKVTTEYIDIIPAHTKGNIAVGQVLAVKTVDEANRPTEWEAVDLPSGGGSSLPTGGTAGQVLTMGEDGTAVWADPPAGGGSVPSAEGVEF